MSSDRLLHLTLVINGLGTGGAERSIADMLPVYLASGIEPRVVCLSRRSEGVHDLVEGLCVPVAVLESRTLVGRGRELEAMLRRDRCDLVHTAIFEADMVGRVAARRSGKPVLTSLVNTSYDPSRLGDPNVRRWKLEALRQVEGFAARRMTTHFHAITEAVKSAAVKALRIRPENITVIPRGRAGERLGRRSPDRRAGVRAALGVEDSTPVILAVGRQEFQKGHLYLLDAIARLRRFAPEVALWLAGREGAMSREIRERTQLLGIADRVRMLGHRDDVPDLMAAADVLAFPSLYEGLGGTLIEAMALELPIVASDLPAIREVTDSGACAILVRPAHPLRLTEALRVVLADSASRRIRTMAGRKRFEQVYTTDRVGDQMVKLMREIAEVRSPPPRVTDPRRENY